MFAGQSNFASVIAVNVAPTPQTQLQFTPYQFLQILYPGHWGMPLSWPMPEPTPTSISRPLGWQIPGPTPGSIPRPPNALQLPRAWPNVPQGEAALVTTPTSVPRVA
jgi:hypothetical protein